MTDWQVAAWLTLMGIVGLTSVLIAFFLIFPSSNPMHWLLKTGLAFMTFGLVVQVVRSLHYLNHGFYPIDVIFPMWIAKDIGASIVILYYAFVHKHQ